MTDRSPDRPGTAIERPRPAAARPAAAAGRRKPGFMPTVLLGLASFAVLFEFLAFQLNSGNDPALGASALAANDPRTAADVRPVVHRRIVKTRVVHLPPSSTATTSSPPVVPPLPATTAPAPAPAPVPAPPVTSTS